MTDSGGRPILPQRGQSGSFSFAPPTLAPRENQRNYVFVDEHNRHKRLKVMRACEGCRRRKIKCDAATTNSWPCAACVRLKLNCVPPQVSYEKDFTPGSHAFDFEGTNDYNADSYNSQEDVQGWPTGLGGDTTGALDQPGMVSYAETSQMFPTTPYHLTIPSSQPGLAYLPMADQLSPHDTSSSSSHIYAGSQVTGVGTSPESDAVWRPELDASSLAEVMGELKIGQTAVAPYIANQKKTLAETPAIEEFDIRLPQHTSPDLTVRIPPEMMPTEQQALSYFDYFFANVHPYVPVINRPYFYQQWHTNRESISPLVLEAIFACATLSMEDVQLGNKWLALANRHEESFRDVPRLSTLQATLLLMKARESVPKRGYFYRSWMTLVNVIAMAKDFELDEHHEQHKLGNSCSSSVLDCITKTRVWHVLYVLEIMVGGPQGRHNFTVLSDTVDLELPQSMPGLDENELEISRQYHHLMRITYNVRSDNLIMRKLRNKKDWPMDPEFLDHNKNISSLLSTFPPELQIAYPSDGSAPWISSHYVANLHIYHQLSTIMHYRPQLEHYLANNDPAWRDLMIMCYQSAKNMCKLQEGLLDNFGITGMFCMLRGLSFTIYTILTCTIWHLVAITAPDAEMSAEGRDFFVRHMRILEQVAQIWPMPEMQAQVEALREAFSADTSKPFELKPTFPYASPVMENIPSPLGTADSGSYRGRGSIPGRSMELPGQVNYRTHHPITPPFSATDVEPKTDSPSAQSMAMLASGQGSNPLQAQDQSQWNPGRILDQWNVAFGTPPPSAMTESPPPLNTALPGTNMSLQSPYDEKPAGFPSQPALSPHSAQIPALQLSPLHQANPSTSAAASVATDHAFVTPSMWQNVVANSFETGIKRRYADFQG